MRSHQRMSPAEKRAKLEVAKKASGPALFKPGDRVVWLFNGKRYPATVDDVGWYRRTKEPWHYTIFLDRNDLTKRMSHLMRFAQQSRLEAES